MSTRNSSGLRPLGHAVLIEHYEPEREGALIQLPDAVAIRGMMIEQRARVLEVGPEAWKKESQPRARVGDLVLISAMAGHMCLGPANGKQYRLINDTDIFAGITEDNGK